MRSFYLHIAYVFTAIMLLLGYGVKAQYTIVTDDVSFCGTSLPTSYQTVSFAFKETDPKTIKKSQVATFILELPAGFEFNTTPGTGTVTFTSGRDISNVSVLSLTSTLLTIEVTVPNGGGDDAIDEIFFNNFQIRATAISSGNLVRNGGTLKINNSASVPSTTEPFVTLASESPMTWSNTSTVSQTTSAIDVTMGAIKEEILCIKLVASNDCTPLVAEKFCFDTDGNNGTGSNAPLTDITKAQVWYSGSSSLFADANTLYGEVSGVNGTFKISGTPSIFLSAGENYFWLTYDIPINAINGNEVDARLDSVIVSGELKSGEGVDFIEMNPVGSRAIVSPTEFYSIGSGDWATTSIWSATDGGPTCNCTPSAGAGIYINSGTSVNLKSNESMLSVTVRDGGVLSANSNARTLNISSYLLVEGSGYVSAPNGVIDIAGNATFSGTGNSSFTNNLNVDNALVVGSGATLTMNGGSLYVAGTSDIDGVLALGTGNMVLDGGATTFDGNGSITGTGQIQITGGGKNILSGATLSIGPSISIQGAYTVTNNASITLTGSIIGSSSSSQWTNAANSSLSIGGALLSTGTLVASGSNNTITYNSTGAQSVKGGTYYNLVLQGGSTKTLTGNATIGGTLTIGSSTTFAGSSFQISLAGDWNNNGDFTEGTSTVVFNGTTNLNSTTTEIFNNLQVDNGSSLTLPVGSAVTVLGSVTNNGTITLKSPNSLGPSSSWIDNGSVSGGGSFIVERYIPGGLWYYVSPPVSGATSAVYNAASASRLLYKYIEATGWSMISNNTTSLTPVVGYAFKANDGAVTLNFSGTVNTGTRSQSTNYTAGAPKPGWNLLSNPYPSAIDWDAASGWTKTNLRNTVYVKIDGNFTTYNGDTQIGTNGGSRYIPATQTIYVKDTLGGGLLGMTNAVRVHDLTTTVKDFKILSNLLRLTISNGTYSDDAVVYFTSGASADYEKKDTEKQYGSAIVPQLYSKANGKSLAVNSLPLSDLNGDVEVTLGLKVGATNTYTITATDLESFDPGLYIYLEDLQEGVVKNLREEPVYTFTSPSITTEGRFKLMIKQYPLPVELVSFKANKEIESVRLHWTTASEKNNAFFMVERSSDGVYFTSITKVDGQGTINSISEYTALDTEPLSGINYYRLRQVDFDGTTTFSEVISVSFADVDNIEIYPNPGNGIINIFLGDIRGYVKVEVKSAQGRLMFSDEIFVDERSVIKSLDLSYLRKGAYYISFTSESDQTIQKLIIQ